MNKITFGVIVTNRNFFPDHLVTEERFKITRGLSQMGYDYIILSEEDTKLGAVETYNDAVECSKLFKKNHEIIEGIIVVLPNFGDEVGVSTAIDLAKLNVPILIQACDDELSKLDIENRRDAFCGKLSLCNNLYQRGIKFTNTTLHTCDIDSEVFKKDLDSFARVCRVVKGISTARLGQIGTRPNPFHTVRYSEKILQAHGITVSVTDMSEIIEEAKNIPEGKELEDKIQEIKVYGEIPTYIKQENIIKQARLSLAIGNWIDANNCDASAVQCWNSLEYNFGCAACLTMSMMGEKGKPSACETDITGALTMYALYLASGEPAGYLDWNNNFMDDRNKCISLHCSNFPKSFIAKKFEISNLDVLGNTFGYEKCFGACKAQISSGLMTYAKITTDDVNGKIKLYVGEGNFTDDKVDTMGGVAVCEVPELQKLMKHICENGFEHHVAMNRSSTAAILEEALGKYMGWDVYRHS